ncbi:MAG: hypothetical protein ACJ8G4_01925 [Burkholderiales bacterium]
MNKLCLLWGRPECEAYISGLIMDSRDGKRQGLPWEAAMELMFLGELSVGRRALVAAAATGVPFPQMLKRPSGSLSLLELGGAALSFQPVIIGP